MSLFYNYFNLKSWVSNNVYGFKYHLPLEILKFQNSTTRMLTWEKWSSWSWNWQRMQKWMRRCVIFVLCSKGVVKALESKIRKLFRLDLPGLVWQSYLLATLFRYNKLLECTWWVHPAPGLLMHRTYFESKYAQQDYSLRLTTGKSTCQISFDF